jgi:hypothetical protein
MIARARDLDMAELRLYSVLAKIEKNPIDETGGEDQSRHAKRNGSDGDRATAPLPDDVAKRYREVDGKPMHEIDENGGIDHGTTRL